MRHDNHAAGVRNLQRYLRTLSYFDDKIPAPPIDGVFGDATERALIAFQEQEGLDPTGRADQESFERLYRRYLEEQERRAPPARIAHFPRLPENYTVELGEQQFLVAIIQNALRELTVLYEYPQPIPLDGLYGESTAAAVRLFQEKNGLPPTGAVDRATWNRLADVYNMTFGGYFQQ